jgi:thiamine-phosphate pyrophosphorylase
MQLIVITPEDNVKHEAKIVNDLFAVGLQRLHLRKPAFTLTDTRNYIREIDEQYHSRIVLCGSFELKDEYQVGGIHLNSKARKDPSILKIAAGIKPQLVSTSFHSWQEIREDLFPYGYVFISPVFDSISKQEYKAGIDLSGANEIKQEFLLENRYCPGIIGLGGVGSEQIILLKEKGFDGAAVLGGIWTSQDPLGTFKEMIAITSAL